MAGSNFIVGYLLGRRGAKPWRGRERTRPKMPSGPWRAAAMACTLTGALVAWLVFGGGDSVGWRVLGGAIVGFVVGMYVVETIWERRVTARSTAGPIGRRR